MKKALPAILFILLMFFACNPGRNAREEIIIFHAGSLSVPMRELKEIYEERNPGTSILLEPAGSVVCARKITELKKPCDIMASADYFVIDQLLMPDYADWSIMFATNEIVIAYNERSAYSEEINSSNWMEILLRDDVIYGRSDPDADPCGYRSVLTMKLAEKYYNLPELSSRMVKKDVSYMRPKEVDLLALMETGAIDYMFQYKSVAIQHDLLYIELPDEINLSDPAHEELYSTVSTEIRGNSPGEKITIRGEYINYSMTIPFNAPNSQGAVNFMKLLLGREGTDVFVQNGQDPLIPCKSENPGRIPVELKDYLSDIKKYD